MEFLPCISSISELQLSDNPIIGADFLAHCALIPDLARRKLVDSLTGLSSGTWLQAASIFRVSLLGHSSNLSRLLSEFPEVTGTAPPLNLKNAMCFIMPLPRDHQLLSVRDACLQKNSGLQNRHSRSSLKMDCVAHPVVPGPPLSTWSPRKTVHGESLEIFAASTQSPCLINIPCHIYTIFRQTFSEKPYFQNSIYRWLSIKFL